MNDIERLVCNLYQARQARDAARKARAEKRAEVGYCKHPLLSEGGPCWIGKPDVWCDNCRRVVPVWEEYQSAAHKAAAALRMVLREGKRLATTNKEMK